MKCTRCGQKIESDAPKDVDVCGSCADDLRQEEDAMWTGDEAFWANKEAYEERERERHIDDGGGYRYI